MNFDEKSAARMKHWLEHNARHEEDYGKFATELEQAGHAQSAKWIREMVSLTRESSTCIQKALDALPES